MARRKPPAQDWGVPNWQNAGEYEVYKGLPIEDIRWQFLRRHPTYRAAWSKAAGDVPASLSIDWPREFGVPAPWDPRRTDGPRFFDQDVVEAPFIGSDGELTGATREFVENAHNRGCLMLMWDPALRPEDNLELISASARRWMADHGIEAVSERIHLKKVPDYLRVIDAHASGASFDHITDIIFALKDERQEDVDNTHKLYRRARDTMRKITGVK